MKLRVSQIKKIISEVLQTRQPLNGSKLVEGSRDEVMAQIRLLDPNVPVDTMYSTDDGEVLLDVGELPSRVLGPKQKLVKDIFHEDLDSMVDAFVSESDVLGLEPGDLPDVARGFLSAYPDWDLVTDMSEDEVVWMVAERLAANV